VPKILLGTPTYDRSVTVDYVQSLLAAKRELNGVDLRPLFVTRTAIQKARNFFATRVLDDTSFTHLLFIDADMGFRPQAIQRMLDFDKDFVGCVAPQRSIDLDRFHEIARQVEDPRKARLVAQNYASSALIRTDLGDGRSGYVATDGFVRAQQVGMGLTLIKRSVLEAMRAATPELLVTLASGERTFQAFEPTPDNAGVYLSEDLSFCHRWRAIGGDIWVCVDEIITHVGVMAYEGLFAERLAFESRSP